MKHTSALKMMRAGLLATALGLGACQDVEVSTPAPEPTQQDTQRMLTQQVGEAARPLWASGVGTGLQPDYRARMLAFYYNRFRVAPHLYGLTYESPPMSSMRLPFIPAPPARLDPYMAEPGRWLAQFREQTGCVCDNAAVGYDPMNPDTAEQEAFVNSTCCELDVVGGAAQCVGPLVPCDNPNATPRGVRWGRLNLGPTQIQNEGLTRQGSPITADFLSLLGASLGAVNNSSGQQFLQAGLSRGSSVPGSAIGVSIIETVEVPESCQVREDPCPGGSCQDPDTGALVCEEADNPQCLGLCEGGEEGGRPCSLPEPMEGPDECDPLNYPTVETLVFAQGQTQAPTPVLSDGIHATLGNEPPMGVNLMTPEGAVFYPAPEGTTTFAVHYYETDGTPAGTPSAIDVVVDGSCNPMNLYATPDVLPVTNQPAPLAGELYTHDVALTPGCYRYVFVAKDGAGFEYTYPTYGSLQAQVGMGGMDGNEVLVVLNDETCPIWVPEREDISCAQSPQECEAGDERPCYTGLYGTQDRGACQLGTESCQGGRWSGSCAGEVTPEAADACGDGVDNDCDGGIDEGCEQTGEPDMGMADMSAQEPDMSASTPDMGEQEQDMSASTPDMSTPPDTGGGDDDSGPCGCESVHGRVSYHSWMVLFIGLCAGFIGRRRRRKM